jgi:predicted N-acetyltransferase YhbS
VITIRREQPGDEEAVRLVNLRAFGQPAEAQIVDALRGVSGVARYWPEFDAAG